MSHNDTLRRLRYALDLNDEGTLELFALGGREVPQTELQALLAKEGGSDFQACGDGLMGAFLDGLIIGQRGVRENAPPPPNYDADGLSNNAVLKKLRIALEFHEPDMLDTLMEGGAALSTHELGALFRKESNKHFRPCSAIVLRAFLKGLASRLRD